MALKYDTSPACGGDSVAAIFGGLGEGLLGIIGLGSLIPGQDSANDALKDAQEQLNNAQAKWTDIIQSQQFGILQDKITYLQDVMVFSSAQTSILNEMTNESVGENRLLIYMLIILVIFLILYDLF